MPSRICQISDFLHRGGSSLLPGFHPTLDTGTPGVMCVIIEGPAARALGRLDEPDRKAAIARELVGRIGDKAGSPVGSFHWAGTESSAVMRGWVDGAIRSGERAAKEVLARETAAAEL